MFRRVKSQSGFTFAELAIALPLMILLMYGLAQVSRMTFAQGANQLADYVLEEEAHHLLEQICHQARAAKEVQPYDDSNGCKIVWHAGCDFNTTLTVEDVWETQYYLAHEKAGSGAINLYAKRNNDGYYLNPITGGNSFGETSLVELKFSELNNNVLHITLEMESLVTEHKIKLSTAVYMPAREPKSELSNE